MRRTIAGVIGALVLAALTLTGTANAAEPAEGTGAARAARWVPEWDHSGIATATPVVGVLHEDPWHCVNATVSNGYYSACFQPLGEQFNAYDGARDGDAAETQWRTSTGREGLCVNQSGYGNWRGGSDSIEYAPCDPSDINEGVTVYWRPCHKDYSAGTARLCLNTWVYHAA